MSAYSRRPMPDRTAPLRLPRGTRVLAVGSALGLATLTLVAGSRAAAPDEGQPPAGAVLVLVAVSDGTTYLPYGQAIIPPSACLP